MKNRTHTRMLIFTLLMLIPSLSSIVSTVYGQEERRRICRACIDCLLDYDKKFYEEVIVPHDAVMLNENPEHCSPDSVGCGGLPIPVSLFIVIDHSASMSVYDPKSKRYEAARALIDTLYYYLPESEIGITVFSNKLLFHSEDDSIFKQKQSFEGWNDAYIPLQQLNKNIGDMKASEKLKWALKLDTIREDPIKSGNYYLVNGNYTSSGRRPYSGTTDISLAFEAAIEALKTARYPKERQFIVFYSDGFSQYVDPDREKYKFDYIQGKNVPCTFTAFFSHRGQPIPNEITDMTENIKINRYSSSNQLSHIWRNPDELASYFDEKIVMLRFQSVFISKPKSLTVNNVTSTDFDEKKVFFKAPFAPLNKDGELKLDISFTFRWDPPKSFEETKEYTIDIKQGSNSKIDTCKCWYQGRIAFYSEIYELKETAKLNQKDMEVRFYPPKGEYAPPIEQNTVIIEVMNMDRSDKLELALQNQGEYFSARFTRDYGNALKGDKILQNSQERDSIIAIYRNPDIPLDTLCYGIPVRSSGITSLKNKQRVHHIGGQRYATIGLISVGVNPYDRSKPEKHTIPSHIMDILKKDNAAEIEKNSHPNTGMHLRVVPQFAEAIDMPAVNDFFLEGTVTIFDPVGNTVVKEREMGFHENTNSLNFVWNGRNDSYRSCGSGTYLVLFKVTRFRSSYKKNDEYKILKLLVALK